jgi:hypothetical protein
MPFGLGTEHTDHTRPSWPLRIAISLPWSMCHSRTVPSLLAVAKNRPSSLKARQLIGALWALKAVIWRPLLSFQNRTVQSAPALANSQLLGLTATESTSLW